MSEAFKEPRDFDYMLLSRLQMDCEYFINTAPYINHLWAGNVKDQIFEMKKLWIKFKEKPEWLSFQQIKQYEQQMKAVEVKQKTYTHYFGPTEK